jgi:hypothetical protein
MHRVEFIREGWTHAVKMWRAVRWRKKLSDDAAWVTAETLSAVATATVSSEFDSVAPPVALVLDGDPNMPD